MRDANYEVSPDSGYTQLDGGLIAVTAASSKGNSVLLSSGAFINPSANIFSTGSSVVNAFQASYGLFGVDTAKLQAIYLLHELGHILKGARVIPK